MMIRILSERGRARDLNSTRVVNISPLTDFSVENCYVCLCASMYGYVCHMLYVFTVLNL